MFLGLGKEVISIMFAIFSVGVTLFASSPQFTFDNGEEDNRIRKLIYMDDFNFVNATSKEIEKYILYNADLAIDKRELGGYAQNVDYEKSIDAYNKKVNWENKTNNILVDLAMIPVYYNIGNHTEVEKILNEVEPKLSEKASSIDISDLMNKTKLNTTDEIILRYWYADYTINKLREFPGCNTTIFNNKTSPFGELNSTKDVPKCTHQELKFIDSVIKDLNYDSYKFEIGNKHQKNEKIFYQNEIRGFFGSYMNWLIIGVVLIVLVGWSVITNKEAITRWSK